MAATDSVPPQLQTFADELVIFHNTQKGHKQNWKRNEKMQQVFRVFSLDFQGTFPGDVLQKWENLRAQRK